MACKAAGVGRVARADRSSDFTARRCRRRSTGSASPWASPLYRRRPRRGAAGGAVRASVPKGKRWYLVYREGLQDEAAFRRSGAGSCAPRRARKRAGEGRATGRGASLLGNDEPGSSALHHFQSMAVAAESFLCLCGSRSKARMKGLYAFFPVYVLYGVYSYRAAENPAHIGLDRYANNLDVFLSASMKATTSRKWRAVK